MQSIPQDSTISVLWSICRGLSNVKENFGEDPAVVALVIGQSNQYAVTNITIEDDGSLKFTVPSGLSQGVYHIRAIWPSVYNDDMIGISQVDEALLLTEGTGDPVKVYLRSSTSITSKIDLDLWETAVLNGATTKDRNSWILNPQDLSPYLTKQEATSQYQPKGDYVTEDDLAGKVDKRDGYDLSKNDFSDADKAKLADTYTKGEADGKFVDIETDQDIDGHKTFKQDALFKGEVKSEKSVVGMEGVAAGGIVDLNMAGTGGSTNLEVVSYDELSTTEEIFTQVATAYSVARVKEDIGMYDIEEFNSELSYKRGDVVKRNGKGYRFNTDKNSGAWDPSYCDVLRYAALAKPLAIKSSLIKELK